MYERKKIPQLYHRFSYPCSYHLHHIHGFSFDQLAQDELFHH